MGRGVGSVMNPSAGRLTATRDETARRACVSPCQFHLRSGRGRSHQGSLSSRGELGRLLWRCCDTHHARLAALTGRMAFLSLGNRGGSSRGFDGRDKMFTCKWLLYLDKGVRAMTKQLWLFFSIFFFFLNMFYLFSPSLWSHCWLHLHLINTCDDSLRC